MHANKSPNGSGGFGGVFSIAFLCVDRNGVR